MNTVCQADSLLALKALPDDSVDMIYTDPPFGTGNVQSLSRKKAGKIISKIGYSDKFVDYIDFLMPHVSEFHRLLKAHGSLYLHLDQRWVHYAKVETDKIFGYDNFVSEIIWSYNFGGRGKNKWPAKHDTILMYAKDKSKMQFNWETIDRIPYKTPQLQYVGRTKEDAEERIARGQVPTDVWEIPILGTSAKERVGYPNQKPMKLIERAIAASSSPGGMVLDPFAGSGTTALAAFARDRNFYVVDDNPDAIKIINERLAKVACVYDNVTL